MDSSSGQFEERRRSRSGGTREKILRAAVEEIPVSGWGRVTTRAVAERAGVPHGAVSYHFRGKEKLLTEAALGEIEVMFPIEEISALDALEDLMLLMQARLGGGEIADSVETDLLMEAMRESARNPALRERLAALLRDYRRAVADLASRSGDMGSGSSSIATLITAVGDGLLLHALLDPELNVAGALEALNTLLREEPGS